MASWSYDREQWVPLPDRNLEEMKLNLGTTPSGTFIWFPKKTLRTEDGFDLHYMEIPVGTHLYRGLSRPGEPAVICDHVDDPANPGCRLCKDFAWYSDYQTAMIYSGNKKKFVYAFEVTVPIRLVNLMDKRNLDIIHARLRKLVETPGYTLPEEPVSGSPLPGEEAVIETQEQRDARFFQDVLELMLLLNETTGYPTDHKEQIFDRRRWLFDRHIDTPKNTLPDDAVIPLEMTEEFGDQKILSRLSRYFSDPLLVKMLKYNFERYGIHGYYAPKYKSNYHKDEKTNKLFFPRELALFESKGFVRHAKELETDGCRQPGGSKRKTKKRRRTYRKRSSNRHTRK